jgi:toxin YoeB
VFEGNTWEKYEAMKAANKNNYRDLCKTLQSMLNGDLTTGLEKTEQLQYNMDDLWSKSISDHERIIYKFDDEYIYIFAIGG